jgi:hypothetical protein
MEPEEEELAQHIEYEIGTQYTISEYEAPVQDAYASKNQRQTVYVRKDDDGSIKIRRPVPASFRHLYDDGRRALTSVVVQVYETNTTPNHRIRDAITGMYWQRHKVGSSAENLFFKVCWATGHEGRQSPLVLYFNGPDEFEKHMLTEVDPTVKHEWRMRHIEELRKEKAYKELEDSELMYIVMGKEKRRVVHVK